VLLSWIEQGTPYWDETLPELTGISVVPREQVLEKGKTQQLTATAVFSDGAQHDVTRLASFRCTDEKVALVDVEGKVKAEGFGLCAIVATYLRQSGVARIVVPQPLPSSFPTVEPNNKIDELVFANLKTLGLPPAEVCTDEVFLRRVFLDVTGTLPTPAEARAFLTDADPQKRGKLIDRLLGRDEFVAFWALKWGDILRIKAEDPVSLWPKGAETYYQWIYESVAQNKPYDQFARESVVCQEHRQPGLVLDSGKRDRPRAGRPAEHESARKPGAARIPGPGVGRPPLRPEAHLPARAQLEDLPAFQQASSAQRERRRPFLPLPGQASDG